MDLLSARQKLVASNIANVDTPGYKTKDIDFQFEYISLVHGEDPNVFDAPGLALKSDGNNVSMDREARLLAENALRFNVASNLMKTQLKVIESAIKEGSTRMSLFSVLSVSASGMAAQRTRAELLVQNLANSETTRTPGRRPLPAAGRNFSKRAPDLAFFSRLPDRNESGRERSGGVGGGRRHQRGRKTLHARTSRRRPGRVCGVSRTSTQPRTWWIC